jgi:hypothetical protein
MKQIDQRLVKLYQEMHELTLPECKSCRVPLSCCDSMYCLMAEELAAEFGITLEATDHPTLKFMGSNGCTVPPYLRSSCTLHTCAINSLGVKPNDKEWTKKYFKLREKIIKIEYENGW